MMPVNHRSVPLEGESQASTVTAQPSALQKLDSQPSPPNVRKHSSFIYYQPLGSTPEQIRINNGRSIIQARVPLAKLTSFRVGGIAEYFIAPRNLDEMQASFAWADDHAVPITLIGAGSNLLISDHGIQGLVICTRHMKQAHFDAEMGAITASAGESLARLAWQAAERGWRGLEWAVGIPGTVGGAVVMNAGAHKLCTADILACANTLDSTGNIRTFQPKELGFSYRTSMLQNSSYLVTEASFQLQTGFDPRDVMADTREHLRQRHQTQPYHLPSCGSVFRNPSPKAAGWLIEQTGLKGYQIGGAQVAQRHANFIVNLGNATAHDIFCLIRYIQEQVEQRWSLILRPEVKFIGEF